MKLVIDLRRAFDSGLGTYIRHVVPASVARLQGITAVGLIAPGDEDKHRSYWGPVAVTFQPIAAAPLTISEQWALRSACPPQAVFWATTLSHAMLAPQRLVATVHDVAQLALPRSAGIGATVRLASRAFLASLRRRAELLMFNSDFTAAEFQRCVGSPVCDCVVTPLGVDMIEWQASSGPVHASLFARTGGAPYFLWLGNLRPHKNLGLLLKAFEEVSPELAHHLVVVGRAPANGEAESCLAGLPAPVRARVHVMGELGAELLPQLMHNACALVVPSLYEGFGLPVLEAFAAGCLVLASDIGALREVGTHAALYFDPMDQASLAQQLLHAAHMPAAEKAARLAAGLSRAKFMSWQQTATLTATALQAVLDRPMVPARPRAAPESTKK
jgi:glycosyltransferase involved in cell wall biosynthesis